jgi:hypothetical protein
VTSVKRFGTLGAAIVLLAAGGAGEDGAVERLVAEPAEILLQGPRAEHGVLITVLGADGRSLDASREARLSVSDPRIVAVSPDGRLRALADGEAELVASHAGRGVRVRVKVEGSGRPEPPSYRHEIVPLFTRYGCNQGACHGKEAGQNGFKLSLRGYAPEQDYERLVLESAGRRINRAAPELSLLLAKVTGRAPHKGGALMADAPRGVESIARWIGSGMPNAKAEDPALEGLEILGGGRELKPGQEQGLLVRARFSDGVSRDVTWLSQFFSNDSTMLEVDARGVVKARRAGATTVRAHYQDRVAVVTFKVPNEKPADPALYRERRNEIDRHVFDRLSELRIPPSGLATDLEFLRRAHLDAIGTLPAPEEVRAFMADGSADRREKLVDRLLERAEFTDYWAQWLGDLLQNRKERDHDVRGAKGIRDLHLWLRDQVARNRPWNELARDVLTATGDTRVHPEVGFWVVTVGEQRGADRSEAVASVAQTFLGTRILCAKCHNHPDERYTQDDYYHFAAFFTAVSLERQKPEKGDSGLLVMTPAEQEQKKRIAELEKKIKDLEIALPEKKDADADKARKELDQRGKEMAEARKRMTDIRKQPVRSMQPRTGRALEPRPLDRAPLPVPTGSDPRAALADWITSPKNEAFSGAIVNRIWKHFLGSGLVETVDDLRPSNPPSNPALWKHLTEDFAANGFDLKRLMRDIMTSRTYQLSSATVEGNELDRRFYSHYLPKRLPAEVLLDAISQATGVPDRFEGYPVGLRAIQLPDPLVDSHFLRLFGRSERVTACACERSGEVTLPQLLHLQNGEATGQKVRSAQGRLEQRLAAKVPPAEIVDELFLSTLSRPPKPAERARVEGLLKGADAGEVLRDLFWALMNSKEFVFNH